MATSDSQKGPEADGKDCYTLQAGDYRRLLHRPNELEWALLQYADSNGTLTAPDSALAEGAPNPLVGAQ